jgi:hypothetical protein
LNETACANEQQVVFDMWTKFAVVLGVCVGAGCSHGQTVWVLFVWNVWHGFDDVVVVFERGSACVFR